jgi:acetoin utilization protein AcuB
LSRPSSGAALAHTFVVKPAAAKGRTIMKTTRAKVATQDPWSVGAIMTPQPVTIGRNETLTMAHRLMRAHNVRHLPVLEHGDLVGIVSQRDLLFLETIRGVEVDKDTVEDAMTTDTYSVTPDTPIATVARQMARKRYGCAVVMERGRVAGIFTATDALRIVAAVVPTQVLNPPAAVGVRRSS